ncbi:unnamed protein product [Rodentolepis nana]|uniref:SH2 domain-containing protein n=1 Tax=Rodentolepis nana TaxID=102285 RepID=A0A0R3TWS0_RODNA|nr:unnamed protein product [Rodentolepis nana]
MTGAPPTCQIEIRHQALVLKQRLAWTSSARLLQHQQHNLLIERIREVCDNQVLTGYQKHQVIIQMQEIRRELKRRNVSDDDIFACDVSFSGDSAPPLALTAGSSAEGVETSTSQDRVTWFAKISREGAEAALADKPTGTFLIRPSAILNQFALSIKAGESVHHCLVISNEVDGSPRFGFSKKSLVFDSLEDLVDHYRMNSLVQLNALLDTPLVYPAFLPTATQQNQPTKSTK